MLETPNLIVHLGDVQKAGIPPGMHLSPRISWVVKKWRVSPASWRLQLEIYSHKTTWQALFVYLSRFGVFGFPVGTMNCAFSRNLDRLDSLHGNKFKRNHKVSWGPVDWLCCWQFIAPEPTEPQGVICCRIWRRLWAEESVYCGSVYAFRVDATLVHLFPDLRTVL